MRVLSLFDGMGCLGISLKDMGHDFQYYTSEIDKHAQKQSKLNFPDSIQLGDVTKWRDWDIDWNFDFIGAGSPCQGFSFAGKQLAFDDPRSALFFTFIEILQHIRKVNPNVKFLLENVKMKKEHELVISKYMNVAPIEINSALLSAQNRVRLYWTNIYNEPFGFFGDMQCMIPQPKDKGILLRDILEDEVDEKYYLSDTAINRALNTKYSKPQCNPDKTGTLNTKNNSGQLSVDSGTTLIVNKELKPKPNQNKAGCFTAGGNSGGNHSDMDLIIVASRGQEAVLTPKRTEFGKQIRKEYEAGNIKTQRKNIQQLEPRTDGKTNCLTSVQKDNLVMQISEATKKGFIEVKPGDCFDFENPKSETRRGRKMEDKSNCLMAKETDFMQFTTQGKIRRLTPTECARLQTIPDWYKWHCSDTQIYKMCGNGWTVDVIKHILSYM